MTRRIPRKKRRPTDRNTELMVNDLAGPFSFDEVKGEIMGRPLHRMSQYSVVKERLLALDPNMAHRIPYRGTFETARERLLNMVRSIRIKQKQLGRIVDFNVYATTDNSFLVVKLPPTEPRQMTEETGQPEP